MRGKNTVINTISSLFQEIVTIICGFILPRLILTAYGSKYNGLTTSITQFLSCAVLLRSGIGGATRAALYRPLANNDRSAVSSIIKATDIFMKRIGAILAGAIIVFAAIYPALVRNEFNWFFSFSLFLIIGASTFAESFFGISYLIVLQADQRIWVSALMRSVCSILNTAFAAFLILRGFSIHSVKLVTAIIFVAYPIVLRIYVGRKYEIAKDAKPNNIAIAQRWDAFWQQVAVFVMNNTDVIVLTAFTNMLEVSVYSVYHMVFNGLRTLIIAFSNGLEAAFGNMIAKGENILLRENVSVIELVIFGVSTIAYTCAAILIISFVKLYTNDITDVNYIRPAFAYIILLAQFFNGVRLPYQLVVQAAGHYKQTKKGAIIEPILNLGLSVLLVFRYGITGVAIGTLVATIFRTVQYSVYMSKRIVVRSQFITLFRCIVSFFESGVIVVIFYLLRINEAVNFVSWVLNAITVGIISCIVVAVASFIFYKRDTQRLIVKLSAVVKK